MKPHLSSSRSPLPRKCRARCRQKYNYIRTSELWKQNNGKSATYKTKTSDIFSISEVLLKQDVSVGHNVPGQN